MTHTLTPSLLDLEGRLIESYNRVSHATDEVKSNLGLSTEEDTLANVSTASIEEYLVLQSTPINRGNTATWSLERIGQAVKIESVYIDEPNSDSFEFQVLRGNDVVFTFVLYRNKIPYDFPENPLTPDLKIRIKARSDIKVLRIILKPVVILETLASDEESNYVPEEEPAT